MSIEAPTNEHRANIREAYKDIPVDQLQRLAEGKLNEEDMGTLPTVIEEWPEGDIHAVIAELLQEKTKGK